MVGKLVQDSCRSSLILSSKRTWTIALTTILAAVSVAVLSVAYGAVVVPYAAALALILLLAKYPEVFLTLFVFAGIFKAYPALDLPFNLDWTATMGMAAVFSMVLKAALVKKKTRTGITMTDFFLVGLVLVLLFGLLYSQDRGYGIERVLELLFLGVLASYFLLRMMASVSSSIRMIRNILLTIVALAGVTTLLTLFGLGSGNRAFATSYLSWSYFLGLLHAVIVILEPLFLISMILTKARGPLISLVVVGILILFWKGRLSIGKKMGILLSFLVVLVLLFAILPHSFWARYELLFAEQKGTSIEARLEAYKLAGELFVKNPLVGAGTGSFKPLFASVASPYTLKYAHNAFLEVAAENGIPGLFFYAGFVVSLFLLARRILGDPNTSKRIKESTYACLLVWVFLFVGSQFSGAVIGRNELFFAGLLVLIGLEAKRNAIPGDGS